MNWGAAVLILAGIGIVAVGVTKSQNTLCQAMTGSSCSWLPNPPGATENMTSQQTKTGVDPTSGESVFGQNIDQVIANCKKNSTCSGYMSLASNDASNYGVDQNMFTRQIAAESGFNPKAVSSAGAQGIAQLMPSTSKSYGVDPFNVSQSLNVAAEMMGQYESYWTSVLNSHYYHFTGDTLEAEALALSSYNYGLAGTENLASKYGAAWFSKSPSETQNYITGIQGNAHPIATVTS